LWFCYKEGDDNNVITFLYGGVVVEKAMVGGGFFLFFLWCFLSQPHFGLSVRMKLTLPKVGTWSPLGLPKTQSLIAGVKTPCIGVFFIPLESS